MLVDYLFHWSTALFVCLCEFCALLSYKSIL